MGGISNRCVLALADGAGGVGGGANAALIVMEAAERLAQGLHLSAQESLAWADGKIALAGGLSTGVIINLNGEEMSGASCGDSEAWMLDGKTVVDLTAGQARKPLLGDGGKPRAFGAMKLTGRLFIASDGITKYARTSDIVKCALDGNPADAVLSVAELARLPSGGYQDDVSIIIATHI